MIQILENQLWILGLLYWIVKHWRRISCIAVLASEIDALRLSASVMRCGQSIGMAWSQCVTATTPQKSWELFLQTGALCLASQKWTAPCNRHRWLRNYTKLFLQCLICPWFVPRTAFMYLVLKCFEDVSTKIDWMTPGLFGACSIWSQGSCGWVKRHLGFPSSTPKRDLDILDRRWPSLE